jgi:hypothetical protein
LSRISSAFRSFFSLLFSGTLPADIALEFGYTKPMPVKASAPEATKPAAPPAKPQAGPKDGAVQMLGLLQRDARLVDFLMEDIAPYSDDQIGAAVRDVHGKAKQTLERHLQLAPVIDGVEGDFTKTDGIAASSIRLIGNVPSSGKAPGGLLRHKGWKAGKIDLPTAEPSAVIAPAELEVE